MISCQLNRYLLLDNPGSAVVKSAILGTSYGILVGYGKGKRVRKAAEFAVPKRGEGNRASRRRVRVGQECVSAPAES